MKVNSGNDFQADAMGATAGDTGTSTAVSSTSLTDSGKSWTTNAWAGRVVYSGATYGVVLSNTGTVLTIDKWYAPASPGGAAASTPATGSYVIGAASQPAFWIALTTNSTAPSASDTTLTSELNNASGGLNRAVATYAHTTGASSYTLSKTFTANSNDGASNTINKVGVFNAASSGRMVFETAVTSPPTLVSGDQLTITETVSI